MSGTTWRGCAILPGMNEQELAWRMAAMRAQLARDEPLTLLIARPDAATLTPPTHCASCGDELTLANSLTRSLSITYRCILCIEAAWQVLRGRSTPSLTPEAGPAAAPATHATDRPML